MFHEPVYRLISGRGINFSRAELPWPPHLQNASVAYVKWFQHYLNCLKIKNPAIRTSADCYLGWFKDGTQPGTRDRSFVVSMYLGIWISMYIFYAFALDLYVYAFVTIALIAFSIVISLLRPYKEQWAIYNVIDPAIISLNGCFVIWYSTMPQYCPEEGI